MKNLLIFLLFLASAIIPRAGSAQVNGSFKAMRSFNADSVTVKAETVGLQLMYDSVGVIYYNGQASPGKWRVYTTFDGWQDLGAGGGGGGSVTASNGLTLSGGDIKLGGALTQNTTINGGFSLDIGTGAAIANFNVLSTAINLTSNNLTATISNDIALNAVSDVDIQGDNSVNINSLNGSSFLTGKTGVQFSAIGIGADMLIQTTTGADDIIISSVDDISMSSTGTLITVTGGGNDLTLSTSSGGDDVFVTALDVLTLTGSNVNLNGSGTWTGTAIQIGTLSTSTIDIISTTDIAFSMNPLGNGDIRFAVDFSAAQYITMSGLPTSCAGAPSGALANIAGVLNVCP